jgi:hypothetical protein
MVFIFLMFLLFLPQDGLVVNLYIPHNRRTPLQAEEALGPISRGIYPF